MKNLIKHYYKFFDEKLENGTIIIFIIAIIIVFAGFLLNDKKLEFKYKANILEMSESTKK